MQPENADLLRVAAAAAEARAATCRQRLQALRERRAVGDSDLVAAREALRSAADRARVAGQRAERAQSVLQRPRERTEMPTKTLPATPVQTADITSWLADRSVSLGQLFMQYAAVGGLCSQLEVDAFVHGALAIPDIEQAALRHAMWEIENF